MIKALCFDVIGTVVDWRGTIVGALKDLGFKGDSLKFATQWAAYYADGEFKSETAMEAMGWYLLREHGLYYELSLNDTLKFMKLWTNLKPYPDVVPGLERLRMQRYWCSPLSNVTREMMDNLSQNVGLYWDDILSSEVVGVKKPDPKVYQYAAGQVCCDPHEIVMVASHVYDLRGAKAEGFRTAYVDRGEDKGPSKDDNFDYVVKDFNKLADILGA